MKQSSLNVDFIKAKKSLGGFSGLEFIDKILNSIINICSYLIFLNVSSFITREF